MQTTEQQLKTTKRVAWLAIIVSLTVAIALAADIIINEKIFSKYLQ